MRIKIGSITFTATLSENATVTAFKGMLPMTVKMSDLNGNEKYLIYQSSCRQTHLIPEQSKAAI